ncbi:MAG: thiol-disulfide isomerase [Acidobacteriota bacterium]
MGLATCSHAVWCAVIVAGVSFAPRPAGADEAPTFARDIAPIVFAKCSACHRPGAMAPMSLMTYEDARPWARAIKIKVTRREMPPWGADPAIGRFRNDPSLTDAEIATIARWADSGAPEGDRSDLPTPPVFADGWSIGQPDLVFRMVHPFKVPADGVVPYSYITIPTNLDRDIWIKAVELKPSDRRVVHHIISDLVEGNGQPTDPTPKLTRDRTRKEVPSGLGAGLVPGRLYEAFDEGVVRRIPAGAEIVLQMHYTTIGVPVTDQTEIGVVLAEPPAPGQKRRLVAGGQMPNTTFVIPPGHPSYEVSAQKVIDRDTYLDSLYPHMHLRGKDVKYTLTLPDGREETLLSVPRYDFNWQTRYQLAAPKFMPKGSILKVIAHFDNSASNTFNPDPAQTVRWGDQSWEEMLIGYYGTVDMPPPTTTSGQR